jgi:predicted HAD superfamily phosphohydrolase YqeG
MVVGAFEQYRIAKAIAHPQINAYRCKYIGQQLFTIGGNVDLLHCIVPSKKFKKKAPMIHRGLNMVFK